MKYYISTNNDVITDGDDVFIRVVLDTAAHGDVLDIVEAENYETARLYADVENVIRKEGYGHYIKA